MKMTKEMQDRLNSIRSTSAQACMQPLRVWEGELGECISRSGGVAASKYAGNGHLFTRIQVKEIIFLLSYSIPVARKSVIVTIAGEPRA